MNINNFFKTLEYLQEEFIPKNNYPKNAIFSNTYKDLDYVLSNNLLKSCNDKYLVFYKENNVLDCIGICLLYTSLPVESAMKHHLQLL